jgi:hypothetical protein
VDKETLSNYGWIVILVLILAVLLALASPFGNFIAGAIKATTAGFFSVNEGALGAAGIIIPGQDFDEPNEEGTPSLPGVHNGIIPEGAVYYVGVVSAGQSIKSTFEAERMYTAGDEFPDEMLPGDAYVFGDYVYAYRHCVDQFNYNLFWSGDFGYDGWGVAVHTPSKATYDEILSEINGIPVNNFTNMFYVNHNVVTGPTVPGTAINTNSMFASLNSDSIGFHERCMRLESVRVEEGVTSLGRFFCSEQANLKVAYLPSTLNEIGDFAFRNNLSLTDIHFAGTMEQWNNITKGSDWCKNNNTFTVHCSNGTITVN